jgi:hypothetical protein
MLDFNELLIGFTSLATSLIIMNIIKVQVKTFFFLAY